MESRFWKNNLDFIFFNLKDNVSKDGEWYSAVSLFNDENKFGTKMCKLQFA